MKIIGLVLIALSIFLSMYVGVWVMFIGGIVQVVSSATPEVIPIGIGAGLARIFVLAPICGWGCFMVLFSLGSAMLENSGGER